MSRVYGMNMTRTVGAIAGLYGVFAFAVFLFKLTRNLEDGLQPYDAFVSGLWTGLGWPVSVAAWFWS